MPKPRRAGFSLTELLVVIAISGILATLVLAALSRAKAKARSATCRNNVRQLGLAMNGFVSEHNSFPLYVTTNHDGIDLNSWIGTLHGELNTSAGRQHSKEWLQQTIWRCPALETARSPNERIISYGYNAYGLSLQSDTNSLGLGGHHVWGPLFFPAPAVRESEVVVPAEMMAIGDGLVGAGDVVEDNAILFWRVSGLTNSTRTAMAYARHSGHANVVFCDGHVESPTLKGLFVDTNDAALVRWNRDHLPHREKL